MTFRSFEDRVVRNNGVYVWGLTSFFLSIHIFIARISNSLTMSSLAVKIYIGKKSTPKVLFETL